MCKRERERGRDCADQARKSARKFDFSLLVDLVDVARQKVEVDRPPRGLLGG